MIRGNAIMRGTRRPQESRGVAAAELAVCLPVIVLIVIATIEACSALFLKQSLTAAAYEGVRTAIVASRHDRRRASCVRSDSRRPQN